jgi:hypothetical protein
MISQKRLIELVKKYKQVKLGVKRRGHDYVDRHRFLSKTNCRYIWEGYTISRTSCFAVHRNLAKTVKNMFEYSNTLYIAEVRVGKGFNKVVYRSRK